jgi:hypothetical protein
MPITSEYTATDDLQTRIETPGFGKGQGRPGFALAFEETFCDSPTDIWFQRAGLESLEGFSARPVPFQLPERFKRFSARRIFFKIPGFSHFGTFGLRYAARQPRTLSARFEAMFFPLAMIPHVCTNVRYNHA